MSPCGLVDELLRASYTQDVRFWADSPQVVRRRFYRVPDGRPVNPYPSAWGSNIHDDPNGPRSGMSRGVYGIQGEQITDPPAWGRERPPVPDPFGVDPHVCGTAAQWAGDLLIARDPPLGPGDCPCLSRVGRAKGAGGGVGGGWGIMFRPPPHLHGAGSGLSGGLCVMAPANGIRGPGSGLSGGLCDMASPGDIGGPGSGLGGGLCECLPSGRIDGPGSGLGGGLCSITHETPSCAAHPDAPDVFLLDVSGIGSGDCPLPAWTADPLSLPRNPANACNWTTGYTIPWSCGGDTFMAVGAGSATLGRMRIDFRRLSDGAVLATYLSAATTGAVPVVLTLVAGPLPDLTWPATLTLTS